MGYVWVVNGQLPPALYLSDATYGVTVLWCHVLRCADRAAPAPLYRLLCRYERMMDGVQVGEETGPLEATIKNLQREIDTKGQESRELQRRWIGCQQVRGAGAGD